MSVALLILLAMFGTYELARSLSRFPRKIEREFGTGSSPFRK
jgi:hypothetical protein